MGIDAANPVNRRSQISLRELQKLAEQAAEPVPFPTGGGFWSAPGVEIRDTFVPNGVTAGTFGDPFTIPVFTVDTNGCVTATDSVPLQVPDSGVVPGIYGDSLNIPVIQVGSDGRLLTVVLAPLGCACNFAYPYDLTGNYSLPILPGQALITSVGEIETPPELPPVGLDYIQPAPEAGTSWVSQLGAVPVTSQLLTLSPNPAQGVYQANDGKLVPMTQVPSTYATARFGVVTATPLSGLYQVTPLPASPGQFNFANLGVVPPQNETLPITNVTGGTNLPTTGLYQIAAAVTAGQYSFTPIGLNGGTPVPTTAALATPLVSYAGVYMAYAGSTVDFTGATLKGPIVTSVSNNDGTLTISPTTGNVVASLALGHANTWSGIQQFGAGISYSDGSVMADTGPNLYYPTIGFVLANSTGLLYPSGTGYLAFNSGTTDYLVCGGYLVDSTNSAGSAGYIFTVSASTGQGVWTPAGSASSIAIGTTTVTGGTSGYLLSVGSGVVQNVPLLPISVGASTSIVVYSGSGTPTILGTDGGGQIAVYDNVSSTQVIGVSNAGGGPSGGLVGGWLADPTNQAWIGIKGGHGPNMGNLNNVTVLDTDTNGNLVLLSVSGTGGIGFDLTYQSPYASSAVTGANLWNDDGTGQFAISQVASAGYLSTNSSGTIVGNTGTPVTDVQLYGGGGSNLGSAANADGSVLFQDTSGNLSQDYSSNFFYDPDGSYGPFGTGTTLYVGDNSNNHSSGCIGLLDNQGDWQDFGAVYLYNAIWSFGSGGRAPGDFSATIACAGLQYGPSHNVVFGFDSSGNAAIPQVTNAAVLSTNSAGTIIGTAGIGVPIVVAYEDIDDETVLTAGTVALASYTDLSAAGAVYRASIDALNISGTLVGTVTPFVTWTDESGSVQTKSFAVQGSTTTAIASNGDYIYPPQNVRVYPGSVISTGLTLAGVSVSATFDASSTIEFIRLVKAAPMFVSAAAVTFDVGVADTFTVSASGTPPATLTESGALPAGVSFNASTGVLSGTPTLAAYNTAHSYTLDLTAANGVSPNATQTFVLHLSVAAPTFTSASSATFTLGTLGSFTVEASGYPPLPPTFAESGSLPSGLAFTASTGVLSGTPGAGTGGTYSLHFTANNGVSPNATQAFTLTVNQAPAFTSSASSSTTTGISYAFTFVATGYPAPTFSTSSSIPSGLSLTSGVLSGTASSAGTDTLVMTASNGVGTNATQNFVLTIISGVTVYLYDTFTGINGTALTSHTMNTGPGWTLTTPLNGYTQTSWEIESNAAAATSSYSTNLSDAGVYNGTAVVLITPGTNSASVSCGVAFRVASGTQFWSADLYDNQFILYYDNSGGTVTDSITFNFTTGVQYTITVTMSGTSISATVNGGSRAVTASSSLFDTATKFGITSSDSACTFQSFEVHS